MRCVRTSEGPLIVTRVQPDDMMRVPLGLGLEGLRGVAIVREAARLVPCCGCHLDH
jgi:hypothetical protein